MTVVWISDTNYHKILRTLSLNFSKNYVHLRSYIQNSTQCFIRYPDTSKLVLKTFSTHFSVSGYRMKHCVSFWIYYFRNDLCTFLAWPSRKSVSKWMLLPHRYLDEMGHTSHSSSKGIISAMLQEAESPPTFSKKSETMFTPLCTLKSTLWLKAFPKLTATAAHSGGEEELERQWRWVPVKVVLDYNET